MSDDFLARANFFGPVKALPVLQDKFPAGLSDQPSVLTYWKTLAKPRVIEAEAVAFARRFVVKPGVKPRSSGPHLSLRCHVPCHIKRLSRGC